MGTDTPVGQRRQQLPIYIEERIKRKILYKKMEEIKHSTVNVNGIKIHIAEKGDGPVVLL